MSETREVWVAAKGFEGYYEVSNLGRVKRLPRYSKNSRNESYKYYGEKILSLRIKNEKRYVTAKLTVNGITKSVQLHVLVLESFIHKPSSSHEANHIDGRKHHNQLSNLEWLTRPENLKHARDTGLSRFAWGESNGKTKLTNAKVKEIKKLLLS